MPIEVKQHLDKLCSFLNSDSLSVDGRMWILNEIRDIEIDTAKSHPAR